MITENFGHLAIIIVTDVIILGHYCAYPWIIRCVDFLGWQGGKRNCNSYVCVGVYYINTHTQPFCEMENVNFGTSTDHKKFLFFLVVFICVGVSYCITSYIARVTTVTRLLLFSFFCNITTFYYYKNFIHIRLHCDYTTELCCVFFVSRWNSPMRNKYPLKK